MDPDAVTDLAVADSVWAPGLRPLTVGVLMAITLLASESLAVATILPVVSRQLGDLRLYGWVFSSFFLASLVGIVVGGALCDRIGVRLPIATGLVLFAAGLVVAGTAPDMPVLVVGRLVQGFGDGLVPAAAYATIGRAYPPAIRPRMFAMMSTAWVVPGLVGPALAAQVATNVGWRWVFLGLLPLVAVAGVITGRGLALVPDPAGEGPARIPLVPALSMSGGAGLVLAGLTAGSPVYSTLIVIVGAALLGWGLVRLTPPGTLQARAGVPAAVLTRGMLTFAFFAGDAYVTLTLTSVRHTSTTFAGLTLTSATMTWTAGAWLQARTVARVGPRVLIRSGLVVLLVGLAGMGALLWSATPVWLAFVVWGLAGFGIGTAHAPTSLTALGWARPGEEGRSSSSIQLSDVLGTALGTGCAGAAVAVVHQNGGPARLGLGIAFAAGAAVAIGALLVSPRLPNRTSTSRPEALEPS